jgi:hypothetical protein
VQPAELILAANEAGTGDPACHGSSITAGNQDEKANSPVQRCCPAAPLRGHELRGKGSRTGQLRRIPNAQPTSAAQHDPNH